MRRWVPGWLDGRVPIPRQPMPLTRTPLRDEVAAQLTHRLVTGELAPGARLDDEELLRLTGTSRAPLREALNQLAAVGLVDVAPRRSTHVTRLDGRASRESLEVDGAILAQSLAEVAAHLDDRTRVTLERLRGTVLADATAYREAARHDGLRPLLDAVVAGTGNPEYARVSAAVSPVAHRFAALHADDLRAAHHAAMRDAVDAALAGDAEGARTAWQALVDALVADTAMTGEADHPPAPPSAPTLRQRAADAIEAAIQDGTLDPGETLRESELMVWLGVSRTPVREALAALARDGLVAQEHHRPARVAQTTPESLRHVLRALAVLRSLAVRLAVRSDADGLASALAALEPWTVGPAPEDTARATLRLTAALDAHCPNRVLVRHASTLAARARWSVAHHPARLRTFDADAVAGLRAAVAARDEVAAEAALWSAYTAVAPAAG